MKSAMTISTEAGTIVMQFRGRIEKPEAATFVDLRAKVLDAINSSVQAKYDCRPSSVDITFISSEGVDLGQKRFEYFHASCYIQYSKWGEEIEL
jgi:hypothetical protein